MPDSHPIRIAQYNPCLSDVGWVVGSFRTEEMCQAMSGVGIEGIVASPFLTKARKIAEGFHAVPIPSSSLGGARRFVELVRNGNFDIVQERPFNQGLLRSGHGIVASLDSGLPFVLELHNIGPPLSSVKRFPMHLAGLWTSDLVLSYVNIGAFRLFGARAEKFVAVPNGYSRDLVASIERFGDDEIEFEGRTVGKHCFGYFGGLTRSKKVDTLLEVAERLSNREDICFVFAGSGELEHRIKDLAGAPASRILYLGVLDRIQTMRWMSRCRATFAIYDPVESAVGNPVKVIESLALGVPVILNEDNYVSEELKSLCMLVRTPDPDEIADRVLEVLRSKGRAEIPELIKDYSLESIVERIILPAYRSLLE